MASNKKLTEDQEKAFLKDLTKLTLKHKVVIGGCGCCGSPYLSHSQGKTGKYENSDMLEFKVSEE